MNPQEFEKWTEVEASKNAGSAWKKNHMPMNWQNKYDGFIDGADAAYNLLSKEIDGKDRLIQELKFENKADEEDWVKLHNQIDNLRQGISEKDEEIKRIKLLFENFVLEDDLSQQMIKYWEQFKKDNQL